MIVTNGIAMSDGVNRKNHFISLKVILKAYKEAWEYGCPSNLNHDSTKFIGWNFFKGIFIEPGKSYVINSMNIPENDTEKESMQKMNIAYMYKKQYLDRKADYDELKELLGEQLSGQSKPALLQAVAYEQKNILWDVFPELKEKSDDGLIDVNELDSKVPGVYRIDKYIVFAHRFLRRNCAIVNALNDSLLERLESLKNSDMSVKIALDPDLIGLAGTEKRELEYQYWWGPTFTDDLTKITHGVVLYKNEHYDNVFSNIDSTEFNWYLHDGSQTLECEELNDRENIFNEDGTMLFGCRYVHSIVNPETGLPNHLDGAIRAYTDETFIDRMNIHIDKVDHTATYTKLWRVDNDMKVSLWKELVTHYYRDNMLVGEYLGGVDEKFEKIVIEDQAEYVETPIHKYVPSNMEAGSGLRVLFNYQKNFTLSGNYDIVVRSTEFFVNEEKRFRVMETETISILKLLKRYGVKVRMPFLTRVAHEDMIFNFPKFYCSSLDIASLFLKSMYEFCCAWKKDEDNRLISFSLAVNYESEAVHISFAGHVNDIQQVLDETGTTFPECADLNDWLISIYEANNKFGIANQNPNLKDIMTNTQELHFKRALVPSEYLQDLRIEDNALMVSFVEKEEIVREIVDCGLGIAPIEHVKASRCRKCGKQYLDCDCIKFIDNSTSEVIEDMEYFGAVWTNRHA